MNKTFTFILSLLAIILPTTSALAAEMSDTVSVANTTAVIVESPGGFSISLSGTGENPDYTYKFEAKYPDGTDVKIKEEKDFNFDFPFKYKKERDKSKNGKTRRWSGQFGGILLGFAGGLGMPAGVKVDMGRSLEFDFMNIVAAQYDCGRMAPKFSLGFGLGCRELRAKNSFMYVREEGDVVGTTGFPENAYDGKTTLYGFNITFPLRICQPLGGDWKLNLMASLDVLTHCSVSHNYKINNEEYAWKWGDVRTNTVGYSLIAALGYNDIGVFCKYTPVSMIKSGFGPDFGTISTGIIIGL